jgi:hypothetical protein
MRPAEAALVAGSILPTSLASTTGFLAMASRLDGGVSHEGVGKVSLVVPSVISPSYFPMKNSAVE